MRVRRVILALVVACNVLALPAVAATPATAASNAVYAAPSGSGVRCAITAPCSLIGARDRARMLTSHGDVVVYLRGGTYRLSSTLTFDQRDSGRAGHPVVWQAYPGERPVISGGKHVTGWHLYDARKKIYRAAVAAGTQARQLYVNGVRAQRARSTLNPSGFVKTSKGFSTTDPQYLGWRNPSAVEVVGRSGWKHLRCPLASITAFGPGSSLNAVQPCWANAGSAATPMNNFPNNGAGSDTLDNIAWLENAYELLDTPGEFYLDTPGRYIYYSPRAGEQLSAADVELPVVDTLVRLAGTPGQLVPVNDDNASISYQGTWVGDSQRIYGDLGDDAHVTSTNGDSATITFTGTGLDVLSERDSTEGDVKVYVDGVLDKTVSGYRAEDRQAQQVIYTRTGLPKRQHTVKLVKESGTFLLIDGYVPLTAPIAPVHDIALRGMAFVYGSWSQPSGPQGYADNQAGVFWTGSPARTSRTPGALRIERGQRIEVSGGEFAHLGGVGVDLAFGTQDSTITGNRIYDLSGSGVSVGEFDDFWLIDPARMTSGDTVSNNVISFVGQEYEDGVGILVGFTRSVTLTHNEIAHTPYSGISLGWGWGWASPSTTSASPRHGTNYAHGNNITGNYVHDVMGTLNDGGLIYTLGGQGDGSVRSVFAGNVLSKATGGSPMPVVGIGGAEAIYQDEGSSWWDTHDNVVSQSAANWNQEWTPSVHDITIHDNYSDINEYLNNGTNVTITTTTYVTDGNWPAAARSIVAAAGLQSAYKALRPVEGYLGNDGELGHLLSPATIGYTGSWIPIRWGSNGDLDQDVHGTAANGDAVKITFTGTGIAVMGERSSDQGIVAVALDGASAGTVDTSTPLTGSREVRQPLYQVTNLAYGQHTVVLTKQSGIIVRIDGYRLDRSINSDDPSLSYLGTWQGSSDRGVGDAAHDVHSSSTNGDSVTATWTGTGIDVVTAKNVTEGNVDVYVDGQFRQTVSATHPTRLPRQKVYSVDGLPAGVHTLRLVKKSGQYLIADRFTVR